MKVPLLVLPLALLGACAPLDRDVTLSPAVRDRLALCGGGLNASWAADLQASVGRTLQEGGTLNAGLQRKLEGALLGRLDSSNPEARQLFRDYLACVQDTEPLMAEVPHICAEIVEQIL